MRWRADPSKIPIWQPIIALPPTLIGECEKAIQWSNDMVKEWLVRGMLQGHVDPQGKAAEIVTELSDHDCRSLTPDTCRPRSARAMGLEVVALEDDPKPQDAVLTVHHACVHRQPQQPRSKMIENHKGVAFFQMQQMIIQGHPANAEQLPGLVIPAMPAMLPRQPPPEGEPEASTPPAA